jgi:hypothetical protein
MRGWYRLNNDGEPVPDSELRVPTEDERARHVVAKAEVAEWEVSTVFLRLDHAYDGGPPVLWETMIFGPDMENPCWRYTSHADAVAGHERATAWLRDAAPAIKAASHAVEVAQANLRGIIEGAPQ